jgi:hypothetical protein
LTICRLNKLECQSGIEFNSYAVGDSIKAKVLKVQKGKILYPFTLYIDDKKTWIELTRRSEHMKSSEGLNKDTLAKSV